VFSDRAPGFPIACLLLRRGLGVDSATEDGQSPLHFAAASTRPDAVAFLLGENADPNRRTALGATPLHSAATPQPFAPADDVRRTIRLLADHGAALGARASNGETPLHRAALIGSSVAVQALLEVRADADAPGGAGWTPLHMAAVFGTADAAEALLAGGAHVDRLDDEGRTPLWRALHAPAGYGSAQRVGTVDTRDVVTVLRRYGGTEGNP
jgi:ankyrin repeat protein